MAKTPKKTPKERTDFAQNAHRIMLEATGQAPKTPPPAEKSTAASERGRKGGLARKKTMSVGGNGQLYKVYATTSPRSAPTRTATTMTTSRPAVN